MRRSLAALALAVATTACTALPGRGPEMLSPPPRAVRPIAIVPQAPEYSLDEEVDEIILGVERDTVRTAVPEPEATTPSRRGVLVRRFADDPVYPAILSENVETRREARRDSLLVLAETEWLASDEMAAMQLLNEPWALVRRVMGPGDPLTVRGMIWPAAVHVTPDSPVGTVRMESEWVALERINERELMCTPLPPDEGAEVIVRPEVRFVSWVVPAEARGRTAIVSETEVRGVAGCNGSAIWGDRLAEFTFDVWMGTARAVRLGGMPVIGR